jgi:excisionase family DNA binding protein
MPESEVLNASQAAVFLGVHVQTIRRLAKKRQIPCFKVGSDWRFHKDALLSWVKDQQRDSKPASVPNADGKPDESAEPQRPVVYDGLVLTGRSILPPEFSPTGLTGAMILEIALDSATHRVLTVACEGLPKLGQEMLAGLLVGKSLPDALHAAKERLTSRYYSELREPVIGALEEIGRKYGELSRQVTHVGDGGTCSVLIVDDDENLCRALRRVVEGFGCRVETATSGAEGLACVVSEVPDLILLDLVMPDLNGPQFLAELRKTHPALPVAIVTGYPDSELMKDVMRHGPVLLIPKPVDSELLERTMRAVVGEKLSSSITAVARSADGRNP